MCIIVQERGELYIMPRGNKDAYKNSIISAENEIDIQENAVFVSMAKDIFNTSIPDLHKPEEVETCINKYFDDCVSKGLRPGNLGLYTCLGLDKKEVFDLLAGRTPRKASVSSIELIKKACKAMSAYRELLGSQGRLNPATLIFWQKNFDGLEDVQRMELAADTMPKAQQTPEEIARQIEQDIPVDADYTVTE